MKRIVTAVLAFLIIICIGLVSSVYFSETCKELSSGVNESIRLARLGDFSAAAAAAENAEKFWEKRRQLLRFTVNHGLLYEVDARITGLSQLSTEEAKEEFLSCAEQTIQAIEYIRKNF